MGGGRARFDVDLPGMGSGRASARDKSARALMATQRWPSDPVELLRSIYPPLLAVAERIARKDAEDLVQETLLRVLVSHPEFQGIDYPLGYAKATLVRLASHRLRAGGSEALPSLTARLDRPTGEGWEDAIGSRLDLHKRLAILGKRQRACLYLRFAEGLDDEEIAALLGIRSSTVRSHVSRAISHLRNARHRWE